MVVRSTSSTLSSNPVNGTTYTTGTALGGGTVIAVNTPATLTFTATTLVSNTQYYFFVIPYNAQSGVCTPAYGNAVALSGSTYTCPGVITGSSLTATGITQTGATLNWTAPTGTISSYTLQYRVVGAPSWTTVTGIPSNTYTLTAGTLTASSSYEWSVMALNTICNGGFTSNGTFSTLCSNELAPTAVQTFSSYTGAAPAPACWSEAKGTFGALTGTISDWLLKTNGFANASSLNPGVGINLYGGTSGAPETDWIISQAIDLGATAGLYRVSYKMAVTTYNATASVATLGTHTVKVVVSTDGGATWSNANTIKTYTGAATYSNTGITETIDLTAYSGVVKIGFLATTIGNTPDIDFHIDDFKVELIPSCINPTASAATSVTVNSAIANWTGGTGSYIIEYGPTGFTPGTGATAGAGGTVITASAGATSATMSSLSASTTYQYYVRQVCTGPTYSSNSSAQSFTTLCAPISSFPWNEGFEGLATVSTTTFPNCWLEGTGTAWSSMDASTSSYNDPRTGSKYIGCFYGSSNNRIWTPGFQLTAGTSYDFSTYFVGDGYSSWVGDVVYNTAQSATGETALGSSFITSSTTSTSGTSYTLISRTFVAPATGTYYFGVRVSSTSTPYSYLGFDDFKLDLTPACPNLPTALTSSAFLPTGATISWTAPSPVPGSGYEYYYSTSSTAPTVSTTPSGSTGAGVVTANLTSLTPSTLYYFWVRSNCNGTDKSAWVGSATFTTACNPVAITQSQGFNAGTIPACWTDVLVTSVSTNPTITYVTSGTNPTTTTAQEGTNMVMFGSYTGGTSGGQRRLVSLPLSTVGTSSVDVEFQWRNENNTTYSSGAYLNEGVQVQYSLDNATWVNAGSFITRHDGSLASGAAAWNLKTVTLPGAAGNASLVYVGFLFTAQAGDNCFLDAAVIKPSPSCITPTSSAATSLTSSSAVANWTGGTGSYIIEYGATGFTPGTGATAGAGGTVITALAGATSATISGLSANTTYQFYVRQVCSGPTYGANSSAQSFTTLCASISTFPWTEGFEGLATVGTTTFPSCWLEGTGTAWSSLNASSSTYHDARTGSKYIGCYYGSSNNRIWTPGFQLTAGTSYDFSTYFVGDGYATWVGDVVYNTSQSATGETALGASFITSSTTSLTGTNYTQVLRTFIPPTTGTYYFGIRVTSSTPPYDYLSFDDFKLDLTPACAGAVGGTVTASVACVSNYNGTATLTASGYSAGPVSTYQWQSSNDNFVTNIVDISGATTPNSYTTSGFTTSGTTYYRLKVTCNSGTATAYSNIYTVVANIPVYATLPYTQSFESWVNGCGTADRPDASWRNSPYSGDSAWARSDQGTVSTAAWTNPGSGLYSPVFSSGAYSARFHSYNALNGTRGYLDLYVDLSTAGTKQLKFDYINPTWASPEALDVLLSTDGGVTFNVTPLTSLTNVFSSWTTQTVNISATSATAVIRFRATSNYGLGLADMGIDNLSITPPCSGAPSAGTNPANPSICSGQSTVLSVTGVSSAPGITYAWEEFNGSTWVAAVGGSGASTLSYTTPALSATKQYRISVTCSSGPTTTSGSPITVNILSPTLTSISPASPSTCGTTPVTLTANVSAGASALWFSSNTSNVVLGTGTSYTTSVTGATTIYASAVQPLGSAYTTGRLSSAASTPTTNAVGSGNYGQGPCFTATQPFILNSVSVWVGNSATFAVDLYDVTGATVVAKSQDFVGLTANSFNTVTLNFRVPAAGSYRLRMAAPTVATAAGQLNREGTQTYPISLGAVGQITGGYNNTTCNTNYFYFYDWNVTPYTCESARSSSTIAYTTPATFTASAASSTLCPGGSAVALTIVSPPAGYTYTWAGTGLYDDAAATTPYTGAATNTVYAKPTASATVYSYTATGTSGSCSNTATTTLNVPIYPSSATAVASSASLCVSGSATISLTASPAIPAAATYQWQESSTGGVGTFTNVASGGTSATYSTGTISTNKYYQCVISCNGSPAFTSSVAAITVSNPQISSTSVTGGTGATATSTTICGGQSVLLTATPSSGASISWYDAASGGNLLLANSNTYNTPASVSTTKSYYALPNVGGITEPVGLATPGVTSGFLSTATGLVFTTTKSVTINSANIYPVGTGTVTFAITNSSGTEIAATSAISVTGTGSNAVSVPINLTVPSAGTGYRLVLKAYTGITDLVRNSGIGGFPYTSGSGAISITDGYFAGTSTSYYYFYNISVTSGCIGSATAFAVNYTAPPALTFGPTSPATTCDNVSLPVTVSGTGYTSYAWSSGASGGSVSLSPTTNTTYSVTSTGGGCVNTASYVVNVNPSPSLPTITATPNVSTICNGDIVTLAASGSTFGSIGDATLGIGTYVPGTTSFPNPLSAYYGGAKYQMLYTVSELTAQGLQPNTAITSIAFNISAFVATACNQFTIRLGHTSNTSLTGFVTGTTTCYQQTFTPSATGWVTFTLTTPFTWNGTQNLIVETVHNAGNSGNGPGTTVFTTSTSPTNRCYYAGKDGVTPSGVASFDTTAYLATGGTTDRPNVKIGYNSVLPITYSWTPTSTSLYSDAGATTVYTGGSLATGYAKPATATTYIVSANAGGCSKTASKSIAVNPRPTAVMSGTANICTGYSTNLSIALTGTGPWSITYTDGVTPVTVTATSSPKLISVSPSVATTYTVTALSDALCTALTADLTGSATVTPGTNCLLTWNGSASSDWSNPLNWTPNGLPNSCASSVSIPSGTPNNPTISSAISIGDMTIQNGAQLTLNNTLSLCGNLTGGSSSNALILGASELRLIGTSAQQITGKVNANNVRVNNTSTGVTVVAAGDLSVNTALILQKGNFSNSGVVTLRSNATNTAYLDNFTSTTAGTYSGTLTVERYVSNAANGYRDISSPVSTTVGGLADDFSIFGQNAVYCWYAYNPYPNVQVYNEALTIATGVYDEGFLSYTGTSNALSAMKGVAIRTYAGAPFTLDLTGAPYTGAKSISITKTTSATPSADGWNLIGNPYPSPVSWSSLKALNAGKTDGSYYVFHTTGEYTGNWGSHNGVTGVNGATNEIASMQGFFVKASASGTFSANNTARVASESTAFYKTDAVQPDEIRLLLSNTVNSDEVVAYSDPNATMNYDAGIDALKMSGGSTVYMSYKHAGQEMAINAVNAVTVQTEFPLVLWAKETGTYTLSASELNVTGLITYLKDATTNTLTDLRSNTVSIPLNGGETSEGRYSVVFEEVQNPTGIANVKESNIQIYAAEGKVIVQRSSNSNANITITNMLGQAVVETTSETNRTIIPVDNTNPWYAVVRVQEAGKVKVSKVLVR